MLDNIKVSQSLKALGMSLVNLGEAIEDAHNDVKPAASTKLVTETAKAKAKADAQAMKAEETKEEKAEPKAEKKAAKKEKPKFDFEAANVDDKIEFLRNEMVKVSAQLNGDRTKVFAFLKKYNAQRVNELSEENLTNLHTDIQVFLGGPDELDV